MEFILKTNIASNAISLIPSVGRSLRMRSVKRKCYFVQMQQARSRCRVGQMYI